MSKQRTEYHDYDTGKVYAVVHEHVRHSVGEPVILKEGLFHIHRLVVPIVERIDNNSEDCRVIHAVKVRQRAR